jgi:serine phosphatase RsbU (regulator of sigma subunit)/anti-sigma regulatory factor (Ser/Thr protein kinase)
MMIFDTSQVKQSKFQELINRMVHSLKDTMDLRQLLLSMVNTISKEFSLDTISFFLFDENYRKFLLMESLGFRRESMCSALEASNPLIKYLESKNDFVILANIKAQQLKISKEILENTSSMDLLSLLRNEMEMLQCDIAVPFVSENQVLGVLILGSKSSQKSFIKDDFILLDMLARQFVPFIKGAQQFSEIQKREKELSALHEVGKVINSSYELEKTFDVVVRNVSILLKAPRVLIFLNDDLHLTDFEIKKQVGFSDVELTRVHGSVNFKQCTQSLIDSSRPLIYQSMDENPYDEAYLIELFDITSMLSIPLFNEDMNLLGELRVMRGSQQAPFVQREFELSMHLANNITLALKNARLHEMAENQLLEISKIYDITKAISSEFDIEKVQNKLCSIFVDELDFDKAILYLYESSTKSLYPKAAFGWDEKIYENIVLEISKSIEGRSLVENRLIAIDSAQKDPRVDLKVCNLLQLDSFVVIPLVTKKKPVAVVVCKKPVEKLFNEKLLMSVANQGAIALENSLLYEESEALNKRLKTEQLKTEKELKIAGYVQQNLLSSKVPDIPFLSICALNIPCRAVGGDFYNFIERDEHSVGVAIGDVSGKGIPAALLMNLTSGIFNELGKRFSSPEEILTQANQTLQNYLKLAPSFYVTAFYGMFDFDKNLLHYCKAGHNPPILYRKKTGDLMMLDTEGVYLGPFEDGGFFEKRIQIYNGDKLILYTDGLTEARDEQRNLFGKDRLLDVINSNISLSAERLHKKIISEVDAFNHFGELSDDLTLLVIEINDLLPIKTKKLFTINYDIENTLDNVKDLMKDFLANLRELDLPRRTFNYIRLALTEILMNAFEHGNQKNASKRIKLKGDVSEHKLELSVIDEGKGFNFQEQLVHENQMDITNRGRGLAVIHGAMDQVIYNNKGNRVTIIKYI